MCIACIAFIIGILHETHRSVQPVVVHFLTKFRETSRERRKCSLFLSLKNYRKNNNPKLSPATVPLTRHHATSAVLPLLNLLSR